MNKRRLFARCPMKYSVKDKTFETMLSIELQERSFVEIVFLVNTRIRQTGERTIKDTHIYEQTVHLYQEGGADLCTSV